MSHPNQPHQLKVTSNVFLIVESEGEFRAYSGQVLSHDGFNVLRLKVTAGENFGADNYIQNGVRYYGSPDQPIPHGDPGQGYTYVWPDELPAGFYRG